MYLDGHLPVGCYGNQVKNGCGAAEHVGGCPHVAQFRSQNPSLANLFFFFKNAFIHHRLDRRCIIQYSLGAFSLFFFLSSYTILLCCVKKKTLFMQPVLRKCDACFQKVFTALFSEGVEKLCSFGYLHSIGLRKGASNLSPAFFFFF